MESQLFGHRRGSFTGADREQQGLFASVGEGTVFLDEISELATGTQAKLLRAIEQKEVLPVGATDPVAVKCRVIAASNRELAKEVEAGRFRADLFYRLDVVSIRLPPLRERREDIPELVEFFVAKHSREMGKRISGVDHATMRLLMTATWRGNVRSSCARGPSSYPMICPRCWPVRQHSHKSVMTSAARSEVTSAFTSSVCWPSVPINEKPPADWAWGCLRSIAS
jgi:transcriptional regulator of aromatic amino acid metabolism